MALAEFFVAHVQQFVPTLVLRWLVRWYLKLKVGGALRGGAAVVKQIEMDRMERRREKVTVLVDKANKQLYGNESAFFESHLGPALKYSACEWPSDNATLADAEVFTIGLYQQLLRLDQLAAGSRVLELGCGWGSLCLSNAKKYPSLQFVAFSNSPQQIDFIKSRAPSNLSVYVQDYAEFVAKNDGKLFDAAVAIETVEHARNIEKLLVAVAARLKPGALFFVHSLLHQTASYLIDDGDWLGRNFFSGGSILALNTYLHLTPPELHLIDCRPVNGRGYSRTLLAWLDNLERKKQHYVAVYGREFVEGFRAFYLVCAECFAANDGYEFMCGYYLFQKLHLR